MSLISFLNRVGSKRILVSGRFAPWSWAVLLAFFAMTPLGALHAAGGGGPAVFAYVDVPRVMASSDAATHARDMLKKKLASKQQEVDSMESEIKSLKAKVEQGGKMMTQEARTEVENNTRRKFREYQRLVEDNQAAIDRENGVWTKKITEALRKVIEEIGAERGYTAVFGKGQVLYANSSIDISDQVLKKLNEQTKKWF
ncbi:MAG: OmpH family outer membrane protein [Magnetococcales bacterium]|nr:OmpH family outer membrane protein [Magnetococcales bacterium]